MPQGYYKLKIINYTLLQKWQKKKNSLPVMVIRQLHI